MKYSNKRALAESALALLIIAIITMGVLGVFVYKYTQRQTCVQKVELCRTTVALLSTYKKSAGMLEMFSPAEFKIDCPICVPGSSENIKNKNEKETMQEIAEHLRWCWYKTTGQNSRLAETIKGGKFCLVCSEFKTDKHINNQKFLDFLRTTKITNGPGAGKTYEQYLDTTWGIDLISTFPAVSFAFQNEVKGQRFKSGDESAEIIQKTIQAYTKQYASANFDWPINNDIQVISYSWPFLPRIFNQVITVRTQDLTRIPCDIYHYQKE